MSLTDVVVHLLLVCVKFIIYPLAIPLGPTANAGPRREPRFLRRRLRERVPCCHRRPRRARPRLGLAQTQARRDNRDRGRGQRDLAGVRPHGDVPRVRRGGGDRGPRGEGLGEDGVRAGGGEGGEEEEGGGVGGRGGLGR